MRFEVEIIDILEGRLGGYLFRSDRSHGSALSTACCEDPDSVSGTRLEAGRMMSAEITTACATVGSDLPDRPDQCDPSVPACLI